MRSVTLSLAVLVSVGVGQVQAASILPLGDSGVISFAKPYGVSNNGLVVGERSDSEAFRWTQAEGMVSLGVGGTASRAYGVSADGSVVVGWVSEQASRWTEDTGLLDLGRLVDLRARRLGRRFGRGGTKRMLR